MLLSICSVEFLFFFSLADSGCLSNDKVSASSEQELLHNYYY